MHDMNIYYFHYAECEPIFTKQGLTVMVIFDVMRIAVNICGLTYRPLDK
jgi:hypothetical protein